MNIEVRRVGFVNKGAELMLLAILEKIQMAGKDHAVIMAPGSNDSHNEFLKRGNLNLLQKAWLWKYGIPLGDLAVLIPRRIRRKYGIFLDSEIDVVLDSAGFSYGDQWGAASSIELAKLCKRWKKRGAKIILLPQAMGPFTTPEIIDAINIVADCSELICARDRVSYNYLVNVVGERKNIKLYPDFTNLLPGDFSTVDDLVNDSFCVIPNYRMIDKGHGGDGVYLSFLIKSVRYILENNHKVCFLVHEGQDDFKLAKAVVDGIGIDLPIIVEQDPLKIKGLLGSCKAVIGSRFHGLVSALSQGVPSIATGWSHKYEMLLEDYGFIEGVVDIHIPDSELYPKLDLIVDEEQRNTIQAVISNKSTELKKSTESMWSEVSAIVDDCLEVK